MGSWTKKKLMRRLFSGVIAGLLLAPLPARAADFIVYSIYKQLDMGNPGETPLKDYYVNMGTTNGLHAGQSVDIVRKVSTYDAVSEKLYREIAFKVATLKIIHAEANVAVGRLEKLFPLEKVPLSTVQGIMIGDLVRPTGE